MVDGYARRRLGRLVVFGGSPAPAWARARTQPDQAPLFEILENGIKSEWIGSTHGGEQILLASLPQLRQQGPPLRRNSASSSRMPRMTSTGDCRRSSGVSRDSASRDSSSKSIAQGSF